MNEPCTAADRLWLRNKQLLEENANLRQQLLQDSVSAVFSLKVIPANGWRWWYMRAFYPALLINAGPVQIMVRCRRLLDWVLFGYVR